MYYRKFKIINDSELSYIRSKVSAALNKWKNSWCQDNTLNYTLEVSPIQAHVQSIFDENHKWLLGTVGSAEYIGLHWSSGLPEILQDSIVDIRTAFKNSSDYNSLLTRQLINRALTSLLKNIFKEFDSTDKYLTTSEHDVTHFLEQIAKPGSGYILLRIVTEEGAELNIVLNIYNLLNFENESTEKLGLFPIMNAFGNSQVQVSAVIGTVELNIKDLTQLSVGDVVSIDKSLNDKISLYIDGQEFSQGYLGKSSNKYSIQIVE